MDASRFQRAIEDRVCVAEMSKLTECVKAVRGQEAVRGPWVKLCK